MLPWLKRHKPELFNVLLEGSILERESTATATFQCNEQFPSGKEGRDIEAFTAPFGVLWEVTRRCNLRCLYCHSPSKRIVNERDYELSWEDLIKVADNLIEANVFQVVLSGGESLLRGAELFQLIEYLRNAGLFVAVITNGVLISRRLSLVEELRRKNVVVAVSLDTLNRSTQAITRGKRAYDGALGAIKELVAADVPLNVLCTLTKYNFGELDTYFSFLEKLGVSCVAIQNLIPGENHEAYSQLKLTQELEGRLPEYIPWLISRHPDLRINTTEVTIFSRLMEKTRAGTESDLDSNNLMNGCSACRCGGYIDAQGVFYPCTSLRMLPLGSLLHSSLVELWMFSENARFLRQLMSKTTAELPGCAGCAFARGCNGGCRGEAFALYGNWYALHDRCPKRMSMTL